MIAGISVIITTYEQPAWLEKVLWGYEQQRYSNFELIIADDGSGPETAAIIQQFQDRGRMAIRHVWHDLPGFQKTVILNKAILQSQFDYLLFTDGDCIPRADFLEVHARQARRGFLLSGGYCKLPMDLSHAITEADIRSQVCFKPGWLYRGGLRGISQLRKLSVDGYWAWLLDQITPTRASFNGCNASVWKSDALAVNGFDERMRYGGLDREFGERLRNLGIRSRQIRHRAIVLHLDHARGYKTPEGLKQNLAIRQHTRKNVVIQTPFGINKSPEALLGQSNS
jgi:glycosyltransferase involved in cell wall biosynthesis